MSDYSDFIKAGGNPDDWNEIVGDISEKVSPDERKKKARSTGTAALRMANLLAKSYVTAVPNLIEGIYGTGKQLITGQRYGDLQASKAYDYLAKKVLPKEVFEAPEGKKQKFIEGAIETLGGMGGVGGALTKVSKLLPAGKIASRAGTAGKAMSRAAMDPAVLGLGGTSAALLPDIMEGMGAREQALTGLGAGYVGGKGLQAISHGKGLLKGAVKKATGYDPKSVEAWEHLEKKYGMKPTLSYMAERPSKRQITIQQRQPTERLKKIHESQVKGFQEKFVPTDLTKREIDELWLKAAEGAERGQIKKQIPLKKEVSELRSKKDINKSYTKNFLDEVKASLKEDALRDAPIEFNIANPKANTIIRGILKDTIGWDGSKVDLGVKNPSIEQKLAAIDNIFDGAYLKKRGLKLGGKDINFDKLPDSVKKMIDTALTTDVSAQQEPLSHYRFHRRGDSDLDKLRNIANYEAKGSEISTVRRFENALRKDYELIDNYNDIYGEDVSRKFLDKELTRKKSHRDYMQEVHPHIADIRKERFDITDKLESKIRKRDVKMDTTILNLLDHLPKNEAQNAFNGIMRVTSSTKSSAPNMVTFVKNFDKYDPYMQDVIRKNMKKFNGVSKKDFDSMLEAARKVNLSAGEINSSNTAVHNWHNSMLEKAAEVPNSLVTKGPSGLSSSLKNLATTAASYILGPKSLDHWYTGGKVKRMIYEANRIQDTSQLPKYLETMKQAGVPASLVSEIEQSWFGKSMRNRGARMALADIIRRQKRSEEEY